MLLWRLRIMRLTLNRWFEYPLIFSWLNADSDKGTYYCLFLKFFRSASQEENFRISRRLKICLAVYFRNFAVLSILGIFYYFLGTLNASVGFFKMFCKLHSRVSRIHTVSRIFRAAFKNFHRMFLQIIISFHRFLAGFLTY